MLKNLFKKVPVFNMQKEVADIHAICDRAVAVFGDMVFDLDAANDKLNGLANKADVVADEHIILAAQVRDKMKSNQNIIDKITKIMA